VQVKPGTLTVPTGQPAGPHPPEDTEFSAARTYAADAEKVAETEEGQLDNISKRCGTRTCAPLTLTADV
jgi:hypothetical protein